MLDAGYLYGEREWFYDTRSPTRRMGVSTHPIDATIVISLWQGDACTGTFRLPVAEAAHLISTLGYGMARAIPKDQDILTGDPKPVGLWARVLSRVFHRWPSHPTGGHLRLLK